jgi:hypothetical protein
MLAAFAPVATSSVNHLCAALVDLTGNPVTPPYAGLNDLASARPQIGDGGTFPSSSSDSTTRLSRGTRK